jgi:hypothetical protein
VKALLAAHLLVLEVFEGAVTTEHFYLTELECCVNLSLIFKKKESVAFAPPILLILHHL